MSQSSNKKVGVLRDASQTNGDLEFGLFTLRSPLLGGKGVVSFLSKRKDYSQIIV